MSRHGGLVRLPGQAIGVRVAGSGGGRRVSGIVLVIHRLVPQAGAGGELAAP